MEVSKIILEYLKVLLSSQMVFGFVLIFFLWIFRDSIRSLFQRIAKIKFPGGTEVATPQKIDDDNKPTPSPIGEPEPLQLPEGVDPQIIEKISELFLAERSRAYLWEYRYLNYFLVHNSQKVLDWLAASNAPISQSLFDSFWLPLIPNTSERNSILQALEAHHLITLEEGLIKITPKGEEYVSWRGPLPNV